MSNVIILHNRERADAAVAPAVKIGIEGFQSLYTSWGLITANFEKLQTYLDGLKPVVEALPDGPEKSRASQLLKQTETTIRDGRTQSNGSIAAVARALLTLTMKPAG